MKQHLTTYFWIRQALFCSVIVASSWYSMPTIWIILIACSFGIASGIIQNIEQPRDNRASWEQAFAGIGVKTRRVAFVLIGIAVLFTIIGACFLMTQLDSRSFGFYLGCYFYLVSSLLISLFGTVRQLMSLANAPK